MNDYATLYAQVRLDEFHRSMPDRSSQVKEITIKLSTVIDTDLKSNYYQEVLRQLIACMVAFARVETGRLALVSGKRRTSIIDILESVKASCDNLAVAFAKLQDDALRDYYNGNPVGKSRLTSVRDLSEAASRGWKMDVDPKHELGEDFALRIRLNHPAFDVAPLHPTLRSRLNFLRMLRAESIQQIKYREKYGHKEKGLQFNCNDDEFILDVGKIYKAITSKDPTGWQDTGTGKTSEFVSFLEACWDVFPSIPIEGKCVLKGRCPDARTVHRVLEGRSHKPEVI